MWASALEITLPASFFFLPFARRGIGLSGEEEPAVMGCAEFPGKSRQRTPRRQVTRGQSWALLLYILLIHFEYAYGFDPSDLVDVLPFPRAVKKIVYCTVLLLESISGGGLDPLIWLMIGRMAGTQYHLWATQNKEVEELG